MSWLSSFWKRKKLKDKVSEVLMKFLPKLQNGFVNILVKNGIEVETAQKISEQLVEYVRDLVDKVF